MNDNLLILGAGQYGNVVKEIADAMGCFNKIAFLDDSFGTENTSCSAGCIGKIADYEKFVTEFGYAIPSVGNAALRKRWMEMLEETGYRIPVLVSPKAYVSPSAQLRKGCVVEPLAGVHANAVVGVGTLISMGAILNHNCFVMDFCHIDCGAVVMSGAVVEDGQKISCGSVVLRTDAHDAAKTILSSIQSRYGDAPNHSGKAGA